MRGRATQVPLAAAVASMLSTAGLADTHGAAAERLMDTLSRPASGTSGAVRFERTGPCRYAQIVETSTWQYGSYTARTDIDFAQAAFTETEAGLAEDGSSGGVEISNPAEVEAVRYRTEYADVPEEGQTLLGNLGATCDGTDCVREGTRDSFGVIVRGPDLAALVDAVEADLLTVGAACAPN